MLMQYNLAVSYDEGEGSSVMVAKRYSGIPKRQIKVIEMRKITLVWMYEGDGVAKDQRKANEWYKKLLQR